VKTFFGRKAITTKDADGKTVTINERSQVAWNVSVVDSIVQLLDEDGPPAKAMLEWSRRWANGRPASPPGEVVYRDWDDGTLLDDHPALSQPEPDPYVIRVPIMTYGDGCEATKLNSTSRGVHNLWGQYATPLSVPRAMRFSHDVLFPVTIVPEGVLKDVHPVRVIAGADPQTGKILNDVKPTFGSDMRAAYGLPGEGGIDIGEGRILKLYLVLAMYDYPARGLNTPFSVATGADEFCFKCHIKRGKPSRSILAALFSADVSDIPKQRTHGEALKVIKLATKMKSATDRAAFMKKHGCYGIGGNRWKGAVYFALHPDFFPGFDYLEGCPNDSMHTIAEGGPKHESVGMLSDFIYKSKFMTLDEVRMRLSNASILIPF